MPDVGSGAEELEQKAWRLIAAAKIAVDRLGKVISDGAVARAEIEEQSLRQRRAEERGPG